jgi:hypothetical protein
MPGELISAGELGGLRPLTPTSMPGELISAGELFADLVYAMELFL